MMPRDRYMPHFISASQLLTLWEQCQSQPTFERAGTILLNVMPQLTQEQFALLTVGERNLHLFSVRESIFGTQMHSLTCCAECNQSMEFALNTTALQTQAPATTADFSVIIEQQEFKLRLINCADLAAAAKYENIAQAEASLIKCCILAINHNRNLPDPLDLTPTAIRQLGQALQHQDPNADIVINLTCPACSVSWQSQLDIADFLWNEIAQLAKQLLAEIHCLAQSYGWSEAAILNLSDTRRQHYLRQINP